MVAVVVEVEEVMSGGGHCGVGGWRGQGCYCGGGEGEWVGV